MILFVWDLHGVLEYGNDRAVVDISNQVLASFGYPRRFTYQDGRALYGSKWYEYFAHLLPDDAHERHLELQDACFKLSAEQPELQGNWMRLTPNARDVLTRIADRQEQILISNTRRETLEMFLNILGLTDFFPPGRAFAVDQHTRHAKATKSDVLAKYLVDREEYDRLIIIGDSPSDMGLAKVRGGVTYLFAHPEFAFRECRADHRIRDLRDVLTHT